MQYIQYDELGNIGGVVYSEGPAPICERQLTFDTPQDVEGMMVDIATLTLVPAPKPPVNEGGGIE